MTNEDFLYIWKVWCMWFVLSLLIHLESIQDDLCQCFKINFSLNSYFSNFFTASYLSWLTLLLPDAASYVIGASLTPGRANSVAEGVCASLGTARFCYTHAQVACCRPIYSLIRVTITLVSVWQRKRLGETLDFTWYVHHSPIWNDPINLEWHRQLLLSFTSTNARILSLMWCKVATTVLKAIFICHAARCPRLSHYHGMRVFHGPITGQL